MCPLPPVTIGLRRTDRDPYPRSADFDTDTNRYQRDDGYAVDDEEDGPARTVVPAAACPMVGANYRGYLMDSPETPLT